MKNNNKKPKVPDSEIRRRLIEAGLLKPGVGNAVQIAGAEAKDRGAGKAGQGEARDVPGMEQGNPAGEVARENQAASKSPFPLTRPVTGTLLN